LLASFDIVYDANKLHAMVEVWLKPAAQGAVSAAIGLRRLALLLQRRWAGSSDGSGGAHATSFPTVVALTRLNT
jgi:hypothetical protein